MYSIKTMAKDSRNLVNGLKFNAGRHLNYRVYTSMERALSFLLDGKVYVTDGKNWNDVNDRDILSNKKLYAKCFSCSTRENIAMWMLYGGERGTKGACLNFPASVMKEIVNKSQIERGSFDKKTGKFVSRYTLEAKQDFEIFLIDVIYVDYCKNNKKKISYLEKSIVVEERILDNDDVFYKNVAWQYEKECRLIVRLSEYWEKKATNENIGIISITLSNKMINRMRKRGLVKSPVYEGDSEFGIPSTLVGTVEWKL